MGKGLVNKKNCTGVSNIPASPRYAPCGGEYTQSDCVFFSSEVLDGSMDMGANPTLSEFVVCLLKRIDVLEGNLKKQSELISRLEDKLNTLYNEQL